MSARVATLLVALAAGVAAAEPAFEACSGRGLASGRVLHELHETLTVSCDRTYQSTVLKDFEAGWTVEDPQSSEAAPPGTSTQSTGTLTIQMPGIGQTPPRAGPLGDVTPFTGQICSVERDFITRGAPQDPVAGCSGAPPFSVAHRGETVMRAGFPSLVTSSYGVTFGGSGGGQVLGATVSSTLTELPQSVSVRAQKAGPDAAYTDGKVVVPEQAQYVWSRAAVPDLGTKFATGAGRVSLGAATYTSADLEPTELDSGRLSYVLTLTRGERVTASAYAVRMRLAPLDVTHATSGQPRKVDDHKARLEAATQAAYTAGANPDGQGIELSIDDTGVVYTPTGTPVLYEQAARMFETRLGECSHGRCRRQLIPDANRGPGGKPLPDKGGAGSWAADAFLNALAADGSGVEKRINLFGGSSDAGAADGGLADNAKGKKKKQKSTAKKDDPSPVQASVTFKARYGTPGQDFGRKAREAKAKAEAEAAAGFLEVEERDGMLVATGDAKSLRAMAGFEVQLSLWSSVINLGAFYLKAQAPAAGAGGKWKRGWVGNVLGVELQSDQALAEGTGGPLLSLKGDGPPPACGATLDAGLPTVEVFKREDDEMFGKTFGPVVVGGVPLEFTLKVGGALELHVHAGSCKAADGSTRAVVGVKPVATLLAGASAGVTAGIASAGAYMKSKLIEASAVGGVSIGGGSADAGTSVCGGVQPDVSFGGGEAGVYVDTMFTQPTSKALFAWSGRKSEWVGKRSACKCGLVGRDQCAASDAACSTCAKKAPALAAPSEANAADKNGRGFANSRYSVRSPLRRMQSPFAGRPGVLHEGACGLKHLYHALLDLMELAFESLPDDVRQQLAGGAPQLVRKRATFFNVPLEKTTDGMYPIVVEGQLTMTSQWPHIPRMFDGYGYTSLLLVREASKLFLVPRDGHVSARRFWMTHYNDVGMAAVDYAKEHAFATNQQPRAAPAEDVRAQLLAWYEKCQKGRTDVVEL